MPRKVLDVSKINALGWTSSIELSEGIKSTYEWFLTQDQQQLRGVHPVGADS